MRRFLPLCFLLSLASCGLIRNLEQSAATSNEILTDAKAMIDKGKSLVSQSSETLTAAKSTFAEAKTLADTNKDGKTDTSEWLTYLLGLLGVGGGGLLARNAKSNARKDVIERRLDSLEKSGGAA
jgi:hypothetical protein